MAKQPEMKIAGFHFTKISAKRNPEFQDKLEISSNILIKNMQKHKSEITKQESLKIEFEYIIDYKQLGKVEIEGILFLLTDNKTMKDLIKEWESKKVESGLQVGIINLINRKSSIKAFELQEELNLPMHLQLPILQVGKKEN